MVTALGIAVTVGSIVVPPAAASAVPVSRIYSTTRGTCLDVSTTDPAHFFLDTYGAACNGSAAQSFAFRPVPTGPPSTFHIVSTSTNQCMTKYRQGIRQGARSTDAGWTFRRVGTTGHSYRVLAPSTIGTAYPGCVQVDPRPAGYPGTIFTEVACSPEASQILTLTAAP